MYEIFCQSAVYKPLEERWRSGESGPESRALVSICTNTIYQIVILELTPSSKKVVVNGPP